jgi:predicted kinase
VHGDQGRPRNSLKASAFRTRIRRQTLTWPGYGRAVGFLVLINGAPGVGKSTVAAALAASTPRMTALDLDPIKHALPSWTSDPHEAGLAARRIAVAECASRLAEGFSVVTGQYLARTDFIEELEELAKSVGAIWVEVILELDAAALATRLALRADTPTRPEHHVNNTLVEPSDAAALIASLEPLRSARPNAAWIVCDRLDKTVADIRALLDTSETSSRPAASP